MAAAAFLQNLAKTSSFAQPAKSGVPKSAAPIGTTHGLARMVVAARYADLPEAVRHESKRTLLNCVGCAIGGSRDQTVTNAMAAVAPFVGAAQATLLGRPERFDALNAALVNGIASHVFDFDDTHAETTIHPAAPVVPALLALA
jgi:2-methylcitrate dehydratase PrpD